MEQFNIDFHKLLFNGQLPILNTVNVELQQGLTLYKSLKINITIHYVDIVLETIDDIHLLLTISTIPQFKLLNVLGFVYV